MGPKYHSLEKSAVVLMSLCLTKDIACISKKQMDFLLRFWEDHAVVTRYHDLECI